MRKFIAISLAALLLLGACTRDSFHEERDAEEVTVSLQLETTPFGSDGQVLTKAEFEDPVDASIHYDYEKQLNNLTLFLFDASEAFETGSFKSDATQYIGKVNPIHIEEISSGYRVDFTLAKAYDALAVVALANYPATAYSSVSLNTGDSMDAFALQMGSTELDFTTDQTTYKTAGIPVHGWKVFGSKASPLKYYKGISTLISGTESLSLNYALVRLQLRYLPEAGQVPASQVDVESVKLKGYMDKYRAIPQNWFDPGYTLLTPFDAVPDAGSYVTGEIEFTQPDGTAARVAYVPEMAVGKTPEPALTVEMKQWEVDANSVRTGNWTKFTYSGSSIRMQDNDPLNPLDVTYENPAWTPWLQLCTIYARKDKAGNDVAVGTRFNLVRHYSYEWKATGIDK